MRVLVNNIIIGRHFGGVTLWPFIVIKDAALKSDATFMNHEAIHLAQQRELLVLPFYFFYVIEFLIKWAIHRDRYVAYRNISFEREAYQNESNLFYLERRPRWNFLNYIKLFRRLI